MAERYNHYTLTKARTHGRPGREVRPASTTIDMHAHMIVEEAAALVASHIPADARAQFYTEETKFLTRKQDQDRHQHQIDLALRLSVMDEMGVDRQIISPAPPQCYYTVTPELGIKAAQVVNDGVAAFCARRPDRLSALGTVALQAGGAAAAEELARCMGSLRMHGVEILTHVGEKEISDPSLEPFWDKAEALGAVVMVHPSGFTEARRFGKYYFNNVIGNPFDTTMALHYLIFDGVLARHPKLKLIAVHGGGYLPAYSGRIDHAWGARSDSHGDLKEAPTTYLKRVYFDTIVFTPHQLEALVSLFGADHVMMGTDYPFDMGEYDPIGHLAETKALDAGQVSAIAGGTARALFGL